MCKSKRSYKSCLISYSNIVYESHPCAACKSNLYFCMLNSIPSHTRRVPLYIHFRAHARLETSRLEHLCTLTIFTRSWMPEKIPTKRNIQLLPVTRSCGGGDAHKEETAKLEAHAHVTSVKSAVPLPLWESCLPCHSWSWLAACVLPGSWGKAVSQLCSVHSPGTAGQYDISSEDTWLVYLCPCLFCMCGGRGCTCGSQKSAPDIILQVLSTLLLLEQGLAVARTCWLDRAGWHEDPLGPSSLYWGFNHTLPGPSFTHVLCGSNSAPLLIQWALCWLSLLRSSSCPL